MDLDGGDIAGLIGGCVTLMGVIGGGIKWAFASRSKREAWLEARIQAHMTKIEARLAISEHRGDHLGLAFQLVAVELGRLEPNSDVLRRAQTIIGGVQGTFADDAARDVLAPAP